MGAPNWIELPGVVNMRDLGGLPTVSGDLVRSRRLLRSDNLQELPPESVRTLLETYRLTDIVDLRTRVEVLKEGDGPLLAVPTVHVHHLTLYREEADESGIPAAERALPWETDAHSVDTGASAPDAPAPVDKDAGRQQPTHDEFWSEHYLSFLAARPDSVLAALRAISTSSGAAIVHCAAGKDRTGTVVGLALKVVGVPDDAVIADYAASAERVPRILERLRNRPAYAANLRDKTVAQQSTHADTMRLLLDALESRYGGAHGWLERQGWSSDDTQRMEDKLLG